MSTSRSSFEEVLPIRVTEETPHRREPRWPPLPHRDPILWALPFVNEWELTPPAVQDYIKNQHQQIAQLQTQIEQLQQQVETLQGRVHKTSQTSSKPPSSDSPFQNPSVNGNNPPANVAGKRAIAAEGQPY